MAPLFQCLVHQVVVHRWISATFPDATFRRTVCSSLSEQRPHTKRPGHKGHPQELLKTLKRKASWCTCIETISKGEVQLKSHVRVEAMNTSLNLGAGRPQFEPDLASLDTFLKLTNTFDPDILQRVLYPNI